MEPEEASPAAGARSFCCPSRRARSSPMRRSWALMPWACQEAGSADAAAQLPPRGAAACFERAGEDRRGCCGSTSSWMRPRRGVAKRATSACSIAAFLS
eukprot:5396547-Alexandrium_andersonii.AAC.1